MIEDKINSQKQFEITFHSIGGQGAYTTGQMLASNLATIENIQTSLFASYSSEKKGAPVDVFIKIVKSSNPIRNFSAVKNPDMIVIFHESLLNIKNKITPSEKETIMLINTPLSPIMIQEKYNINCNHLYTIDATSISLKTKSKINTIMYGSIINILKIIKKEEGQQEIKNKLSYRYEHLVASNIEAFDLGFDNLFYETFTQSEINKNQITNELGYNNQHNSGYIYGSNSQLVERSLSREGYIPQYNKDLCINCTKCDMSCPDDCFVWEEVEGRRGRMEMQLVGIDYNYCKGCLRCVTVCPSEALTTVIEEESVTNNGINKIYQLLEEK